MRLVKVAACALNQIPFDWNGNHQRILEALTEARNQSASFVCLPELSITGYGCEDVFLSLGLQREALNQLKQLIPYTKGLVVCFGLPLSFESSLYNTVAVVADGELLGFAAKNFLPVDGIHYEPRWFKPWPRGKVVDIEIFDKNLPLGSVVFDISGIRLGFEICEDAWVPSRPGRDLSEQAVDLIFNPSASHFAFNKYQTRKQFVLEGSRAFGVGYVYANLLGNEAGRVIYDGSSLIASNGKLIALGKRFSFKEVEVCSAQLDIDENRIHRNRSTSARLEPNDLDDGRREFKIVSIEFSLPELKAERSKVVEEIWEKDICVKEQEFCRAVTLGLFDYLRKSRSNGFVVSLSGGIDSSVTAILVAAMVALAEKQLGFKKLLSRLSYIPEILDCKTRSQLVNRLLTCAYQETDNSSESTSLAAKSLASEISAQFFSINVQSLVDQYRSLAECSLGTKLSWENHDLALQNIQARVRGPYIWMLANLKHALLLATSNRSEAAVGYTTMDGDTCGGLSPIGGVDKAFLIEVVRWFRAGKLVELGEIAALDLVIATPPSAELRPQQRVQTDETDLMPYKVLDYIERAAIRDKLLPGEIAQIIGLEFPDYESQQLAVWIRRFFELWSRNQWKRERYAPSFHLDDENLDPKTWCRFPILSGNYRKELAEF